MEVSVTPLEGPSPASLPLEMVERKGLGHPDTICDALAENLSVALSRFYVERFGAILHHNVDKALLWGGAARPAFGGGEVLAPIEIYLAGRATAEHVAFEADLKARVAAAGLANRILFVGEHRDIERPRLHGLLLGTLLGAVTASGSPGDA